MKDVKNLEFGFPGLIAYVRLQSISDICPAEIECSTGNYE